MGQLDGKVAVVTGAASGIGLATAEGMAREGAKVVVADLDGAGAEKVAAGIRAAGGEAIGVRADVSRDEDVKALMDRAVEHFGSLHVLHNNAAAVSGEHLARDGNVVTMDRAVWDYALSVTLTGVMLGCKYAIPHMLAAGGGSIVNTSSGSSLRGELTTHAYSAAKAGVNSLTQCVATTFGRQGIRCNAVAPGVTRFAGDQSAPERLTAANRNIPEALMPVMENNILLPRLGEPDDLAKVVIFLASDASYYIQGQVIAVDGGLQCHQPFLAQLMEMGMKIVHESVPS